MFDAIGSDPEPRRLFGDLVGTDRADVYRYQGEDSLVMLGIHETGEPSDDVVLLCGEHDEDAPPGTVETTDPRVRSWAESYYRSVRENSEPLDTDAFVVEGPEVT